MPPPRTRTSRYLSDMLPARGLFLSVFFALAATYPAAAMPSFHVRPISPEGVAFYRETLLPADIDKDGDLDFFSGAGRGEGSYWFEHSGQEWIRRPVSDSNEADVGAALLDVDGDGWLDKVSASFWYRNPGFPAAPTGSGNTSKDRPFGLCRYTDLPFVHDLYTADMDGDNHPDILAIDYDGIRWFKVERDSACRPWAEHKVNGAATDPQQHGGIAAGDLDGDGDMDVSRLDRWFENLDGKGTTWTEHKNLDFGTYWSGGWGLSGRALIDDMDGDGDQDILQADCDLPNGRVAWFENLDGKGLSWERRLIKDSTDGQDFHSLIRADFDGDGDKDIFSSGGPNTVGTPTAYIWENRDGKGGTWREHIVNQGKKDHEAVAADLDGDGDIDILVKTWGQGEHYYLENQRVPIPGTGIRNPLRRPSVKTGSYGNTKVTASTSNQSKRFRIISEEYDAGGRHLKTTQIQQSADTAPTPK